MSDAAAVLAADEPEPVRAGLVDLSRRFPVVPE